MQKTTLKQFTGQLSVIRVLPIALLLEWAKANGYVVFTHDLDFGAILAATQVNAPSVIQLRIQDVLSLELQETVISALQQFQAELESGALVTIDPIRARARILPIV